jgi:MoxR-like ATPase
MKKVLNADVIGAINKLGAIKTELKGFIKERDEVLDMIVLALVAKRNLFFLGLAGQAKTLAVKAFNQRITGSNYMEVLMNKMMDKDELYGRLDIPELIKGVQKVIIDGKIPDSDVIFVDEVFKGNDLTNNTMLKTYNYEDINLEGNVLPSRHLAVFSASNEIPNFKKEEDKILYPLYDRFHLKMKTEYIQDKNNFKDAIKAKRAMLSQSVINTISLDEIKMLNKAVWGVEVPEEIDELIWDMFKAVEKKLGRPISDRKMIEVSVILQAHALLDMRDKVEPKDMMVCVHYLWDTPEEIPAITEIVKSFCENPMKDKVNGLKALAVEQLQEAYKIAETGDDRSKNKAFTKTEKEFFQLHTGLEQLKASAKTDEENKVCDEMLEIFENMYKELNQKFEYTYLSVAEQKRRSGM